MSEHPKAIPDVILQTQSGVSVSLSEALRCDRRVRIVSFIYTRCNAICSAVGTEFQQLQDIIERRGLGQRVGLLSLSFDERDTPTLLSDYARRMHAKPQIWQFAGIADAKERTALLAAFGIVVIPAPLGEFQHNAAFHLLVDGQLARIVDYDDPDTALASALSSAENPIGRGKPGSGQGKSCAFETAVFRPRQNDGIFAAWNDRAVCGHRMSTVAGADHGTAHAGADPGDTECRLFDRIGCRQLHQLHRAAPEPGLGPRQTLARV
ncbi:SCO family protein [Undibacterium arcticum]|uniref:SCO family protein n=1 Tax=Undibacterium arcticum TaxID=1762892 RepID=UPI003620DC5C